MFILQAEPALMYDSVQVFAVGLRTLEQSHALRPANVSCELEKPWDGGLSLINYINSVSIEVFSKTKQTNKQKLVFDKKWIHLIETSK